jgi:hypothetical protein
MPPIPHTPDAEASAHAERIVALDAGDLAGRELQAAETLVRSCAGCAALAGDLAAIRDSMSALPVPIRRRDYRLTAEDAARLRPSAWRRVIEWLAAPGSSVRPLATGLATLGIVGLLLTSVPGGLSGFGGGAAPIMAPAPEAQGDSAAPAGAGTMELGGTSAPPAASGSPDATAAPAGDPALAATAAPAALPAGTPPADEAAVAGEAASGDPTADRNALTAPADGSADEVGDNAKMADADATSPVPLAALVSLTLLVAGLALLTGRAIARRRL